MGDEDFMNECYETAKRIFKLAVRNYTVDNPNKTENSLFKNRGFDKDYVKVALTKHMDAKAKIK